MLINFLSLSIGLVLLWYGADRFVKGGEIAAARIGMSTLVVGLTLGAVGTSLPELVVSWLAAGVGNTGISIGNVVGSNMANIGLALGAGALIFPVSVEKEVIRYDYWVLLVTGLILYLFSRNLVIGQAEGAVMLLLTVLYIGFLGFRWFVQRVKVEQADSKGTVLSGIVFLLVGTGFLAVGAKLVVGAAVSLASSWGVSETVIGITIVAVGTSLPEIAVVVAGGIKRVPGISIGTVIGSNIFNILLITGGSAVIGTININRNELIFQAPAVILFTLILFPVILFDRKISRVEGAFLLFLYGLYCYLII